MQPLGFSSQVFVLYLLVLMPVAAYRSARVFNAPPPTKGEPARKPLPSLSATFVSTLLVMLALFGLTWFTARTFDYHIFAVPRFGVREILAGIAALACAFGLVFVNRAVRSAEEIQAMPVARFLPKTRRETVLYSCVAIAAGISEEAAYRGVLTSILWYAFENQWLALLLSAVAFALAHMLQGWKSMLVVFLMACVMQELAWHTGTLVIAMVVHAAYDLAAPTMSRKLSRGLPTDLGKSAG